MTLNKNQCRGGGKDKEASCPEKEFQGVFCFNVLILVCFLLCA